ncbi:hypothetical protein ACTVJH_01480 [Desulfoplanes sp. PS50]|jgi:hypothetical protein
MMELPGHYLGAVNTSGDPASWSREFSLEIRSSGSYALFVRDEDGYVMMVHSGTSGRSLAEFVLKNGFDHLEIQADIRDIDPHFAAEYARIIEERT